jgi:hypothetical protein
LIVHFKLDGGDTNNFILTSDGAAKSIPITVTCPAPQVVECGSSFVYPPVSVDTCRSVTAEYDPAEDELVLGLNTVTVTVTDEAGDTGTCSFVVDVVDTTPPVQPTLADVTGSCGSGATPTAPTTTDACDGIVTGTTMTEFPITQIGTNLVTWSFTDSKGNVTTATQRVIISGYTFVGFHAPINGVGGSCSSIVKEINMGSTVPIKFDFKCGSTFITSGPKPIVKVQRFSNSCGFLSEPISLPAEYNNDWHINWNTSGWWGASKGIYKIIVVLPDGSSHFVFVKVK